MGVLSIEELKELRGEIVTTIANNPDAIVADSSLDYASILELIRTTGRTDLFRIALDKVNQIEDKSVQASAWVEVLDAIETEISLETAVEEDQTEAAEVSEAPETPEHGQYQ